MLREFIEESVFFQKFFLRKARKKKQQQPKKQPLLSLIKNQANFGVSYLGCIDLKTNGEPTAQELQDFYHILCDQVTESIFHLENSQNLNLYRLTYFEDVDCQKLKVKTFVHYDKAFTSLLYGLLYIWENSDGSWNITQYQEETDAQWIDFFFPETGSATTSSSPKELLGFINRNYSSYPGKLGILFKKEPTLRKEQCLQDDFTHYSERTYATVPRT